METMQDSSPASDPAIAVPPTGGEPAMHRGALTIVFLVVFIDLLGFGIVLPLLPLFGRQYIGALLPGKDLAPLVGMILGLLMASFSAMQFIFAPIWGRISDRVGRRPILLLGLFGSVVFYALFGFAANLSSELAGLALTLLFLSRLGAGTAGATIATAQAAIADSTTPEKRKLGMALIGAAFGIGFALGPLIGFGSLRLFSHQGSPGFAAAGLSCVAFLLGLRLLPETRKFGQAPPATRKWFSWQQTREVLAMPSVGLLVLVFFLTTMGFGSFEPTLAPLCEDVLALKQDTPGEAAVTQAGEQSAATKEGVDPNIFLVFAFIGFVLLFTQGFVYRRLAPRLHEEKLMTIGIALMGLGLLALGCYVFTVDYVLPAEFKQAWSPQWYVSLLGMLVTLTLSVVGFAFLTPSVQALISRRSDPERQGEVLGVNQSFSALARIIGPFLGLTFYHLHPSHLVPYVFGALILLAMLPLLPRISRKEAPA
jgi:MFS family permease